MYFRNQRRLRQIFITGHIIGIAQLFLPYDDGDPQWLFMRYLLTGGDTAAGLYHLATLVGRVAFLALAIYYPKRWVFVAGAAWASLVLSDNLIRGTFNGTFNTFLTATQLLMRMTGFLIK